MSQATDLLNRLTNEQILAYSADPESEPHIVIGADRFITVPKSLKRVAVQYDHDVETVVFDCPRYWDNLDMSTMAVYINYVLSDGYADSYPADNVTADGDIMHFSWTISRNVTQVTGNITFLVCVKKTDAEGKEINHWNSELCRDMYVSEGLETEEQIAMENSDLITQLLLRMNSVEQINVTAETMDGYVEEITTARDDAAVTLANINDSAAEIRNSYANAIKGNASGEIVRVDDVSPLEHDISVKVCGRNRFNIASYQTEKDYSTGKTIYAISAENLVIGKTYTVSSTIPMRWFKISNSASGYSCVGLTNSISGFTSYTFTHNRHVNIGENEPLYIYTDNLEQTAMGDLSIMEPMEIMIVEGSVATKYEPYIDPSTITVIACGKNLAPEHTFCITGTAMSYGSIGDFAGSVLVRNIPIKPGATYVISALKPAEVSSMTAFLYNGLLSDSVNKHNGCYTAVSTAGRGIQIGITGGVVTNTGGYEYMAITTGNTSGYTEGSSVTINIKNFQIELGKGSAFEAYNGATYTPDTDGTCFVKSSSPTTTLFTDTPGAIIEAEYNRDTTKMFESYVLTDEAKDEIAEKVEGDMAEVLASLNSYAQSVIGGDG